MNRIEKVLRYCLFDLRNYRAWSRDKRKRAKFLHRAEDWTMFSAEDTVQEETLVVFYTRIPRETVRQRGKKWRTQENLAKSKHPLQYRKFKTQTDEKIWNSLKAGPATKAKNPLSMVGKMKKIVMWFFTSSRMSWLQVWKHSWLSLLISTCWRWERTQRKVEEEGTQGAVASLKEKKKSKVVYLKTQIQWVLFYGKLKNWDWTLRRNTPEILRMHLVRNKNSVKKKGNLESSFWRTTTWGNLTTSRLWQQSGVEFGEKRTKAQSRRQPRFILLWRRQRHRRSYVWYGFGSFNAQCWAKEN